MVRNEGTTTLSPFPPSNMEWGLHPVYGSSFQATSSSDFFPLLLHALSSWAAVLFYSNVGSARLQLPLRLTYLLQCGIFHGLQCRYPLHCGLCSSTWSTSPPPSLTCVSRSVCSTLSSSLLCSVFYRVLHKFSQRHHKLLCQAQLCPAVSPFWSHLELTVQHRAVPGFFSRRPSLQLPPLPKH